MDTTLIIETLKSLLPYFSTYYGIIANKDGGLLPGDVVMEIQSALQKGSLKKVRFRIEESLEMLENASLNIAVIGESGSGKSTFINAFRGIGHKEVDSASTGVEETTTTAIPYEHPKYPNVKLWDLPGIGTPNFHPDTYLDQVEFNHYNFFIILSSSRFTANDVKLVQAIRERNKKFFFVRTMVDIDLDNERKSKPKSFCKERMLRIMRENCLKNLCIEGLREPQVFLISNFDLSDYDFPKLEATLLNDLLAPKRYTFVLALPNISETTIERKKAVLQERIWLEALKCAALATVPCAGFIVNDLDTLDKCLKRYREILGVDDKSLLQVAQKLGQPLEKIKASVKSLDLLALIKEKNAMEKLLKLVEGFCSFQGGPLGAGFHFGKTYFLHLRFLDAMAADAKTLCGKF